MKTQVPILTVCLNPALDVATTVPQIIAGPKLRCTQPRFDPGGGGVNVARAVCKLRGKATALVAVGGFTGDRLLGLLTKEGVPTLPVRVSGETRQSFAVTDQTADAQYRFSVPGEEMIPEETSALLAAIVDHTPLNGFLVISGSVAPGVPEEFISRIIAATLHKSPKVIVDMSGAALDRLIAQPTTPVHLLRVNQKEAAEAAAHPMDTISDSVSFAEGLVARGVAEIVVTGRGAEGSVLVSKSQRLICHPPLVPVRSKIGAGDAFVGAVTLALAQAEPQEIALQRGVSAASATVGTEGTALCHHDTAQLLFDQCLIEFL